MLTAKQRTERLANIDREQAAIEDSIERNNGGKFSDEQRQRYNALQAEYAKLKAEENATPLPRRTQTGSASPLGSGDPSRPDFRPQRGEQDRKPARWMNLATGEEVRTYGRDERIADDYADADGLSLGRFIRGIVTGNWNGAEREKMALSGSGVGGSVLVPDPLAAQWLDLARAQSVLFRAGMQTVDMTSDTLRVAKLANDPTFGVYGEDQEITGSDVTFTSVLLVSRKIATIITMSREIAEDAPNAASAAEDVLGRSLAVAIDGRCLTGNGGADGVLGITTDSSVVDTGTSSTGAILWDDFHAGAVAVRERNYEPNAVILHPTILGDAQLLKSGDGTNSAALWLGPPPSVANLPFMPTTGITTANALVGDFTHCMFGFRTGALLETSNVADQAFEKHQLKIKVTQRFAFVVAQGGAIQKISGITT